MNLGNTVIKSAPTVTRTYRRESINRRPWLVILLYQLLLLGIGGSLAWLLGMILVNFYPNRNPEVPLVVKVLEGLKTRTPTDASPSPSASPASSSAADVAKGGVQGGLGQTQRQQLQTQLQQLQAQMKLVRDRTSSIEMALGKSRDKEPVETRLQAISEQLQAPPATPQSQVNANANQVSASSPPLFQGESLKVTLPSDVLFKDNYSVMRPQAGLILDKVIADLDKYQKATIRIAVHTDDAGDVQDNRELSFQRARAIDQYISRTLSKQHHSILVGYGESRPLVENISIVNRQRNRRVEIAIYSN